MRTFTAWLSRGIRREGLSRGIRPEGLSRGIRREGLSRGIRRETRFVTPRERLLRVLLTLVAAATLGAAQCEDSSARERSEYQSIVAEASRQLETLNVSTVEPGSDAYDAVRKRLEDLVGRLARARDGSPGQQSAGDLLAGTARRELGAMSLGEVEAIEAEHRASRELARSQIDAAMRLESLVVGRERVDATTERAGLAGEKALAEERLGALEEAVASLDGPITQQEAENKTDVEAATQLVQEAALLRRQSLEQGHAAGLDEFEEAVRLEREADQHEFRVAQRENDLRYDLRPEHEMATTQIAYYQSLISKIGETTQTLDEHDRSLETQVAAARAEIASIRERLDATLAEVAASTDGPLAAAQLDALRQLEEAITLLKRAAGKAGRGEGAAAKLALARAQELLARLHLSRARDLADQGELLSRLVAAGDALGGAERAPAQAAALSASDEARAAALQALEEARESAAAGDGFGSSLDVSLAILRGEPVEPSDAGSASGDSAGSGSAGATDGAGEAPGFGSPAEALDVVKSLDASNVALTVRFLDSVRATDDTTSRLVESLRRMLDVAATFNAAVIETFGQREVISSMPNTFSPLGFPNARITETLDDHALIAYDSAVGPQTLRLFEENGRWLVDGQSLMAEIGSPEGARAVETSLGVISKVLEDFAPRVRAGEFPDVAALNLAMQAEMARAMQEAVAPLRP